MLDETLDDYLEHTVSPEKYGLYAKIISLLEGVDHDTIQDELIGIINSVVGDEEDAIHKPDNEICDELHSHLSNTLIDELHSAGVVVVEGIRLNDVFELYAGILQITSSEDVDALLAVVSGDSDTIGKLSEMLHLTTSTDTCHWEVMMDDVSPELIKLISKNIKAAITDGYNKLEQSEGYLEKLRVYAQFIAERDQSLLMFSMVDTVVMGGEFETYINSGLLHDLFDGNDMPKLALELYGMALMSSDARQDPVTAVRVCIEKYVTDTSRIVKLNADITHVNALFVKFYQLATANVRN